MSESSNKIIHNPRAKKIPETVSGIFLYLLLKNIMDKAQLPPQDHQFLL